MGFTAKKAIAARNGRNTAKGPLTHFSSSLAPVKAGPKNSTGKGPKGNSTKTKTRFNRAMLYRAKGEKII